MREEFKTINGYYANFQRKRILPFDDKQIEYMRKLAELNNLPSPPEKKEQYRIIFTLYFHPIRRD